MSRLPLLMLLLGVVACQVEGYGDGPVVYSEPTAHIGNSWLFSSTRINRIEIELDDDATEILRSERRFSYPRNKVRGQGTIDGEEVGEVAIRMRGGLGSYRIFDEKPKLEIDFNEFSGERFYGLESLSLNNFAQDCSGLRESLAHAAYGLVGVPTSRTGFAQLFVNGQDYGLYLVLETQDDRWLRRNFVDSDGNLYDGKYVYSGYWPTTVDFGVGRDHWFDLEEGRDVEFADIALISEAVGRADESGEIDDEFWPLVDWAEIAALLSADQWMGNSDSYTSGPNNYRVYFEPGAPLVVIPWDTDAAFPVWGDENDGNWAVRFEPDDMVFSGGSLIRVCMADPDCSQLWDDLSPLVEDTLLDGQLLELGLQLHALIEEGMRGDPRQECGEEGQTAASGNFKAGTDAILEYLETGEVKPGGCSHGGSSSAPRGLPSSILAVLAVWVRRRQTRLA